jgi:hypothetical protein
MSVHFYLAKLCPDFSSHMDSLPHYLYPAQSKRDLISEGHINVTTSPSPNAFLD